LAATPSTASLAVDGRTLTENPASLTVGVDDRDHEIRATLAGYEPYVRTVRFERDLSLDIMLQPSASPAVPSPELPSAAAPRPAVKGGRSLPRAPVPITKSAKPNCDPPFYFDNGIKVYKPGCL
jgi:hypothetical protein